MEGPQQGLTHSGQGRQVFSGVIPVTQGRLFSWAGSHESRATPDWLAVMRVGLSLISFQKSKAVPDWLALSRAVCHSLVGSPEGLGCR